MFIGENLKNLRILFGYSQSQLAEKAGMKERQIWQFENGYQNPDFNEINILKSIFHVKSNYFHSKDIVTDKKIVVDVSHISIRY